MNAATDQATFVALHDAMVRASAKNIKANRLARETRGDVTLYDAACVALQAEMDARRAFSDYVSQKTAAAEGGAR